MPNELMSLEELKVRLKVSDTSQDAYLDVVLDDAVEYVCDYCGNSFLNGLPGGVKRAITLLVRLTNENSNVASQSLGDMSKSFFQGQTFDEARDFLLPYRKLKW